MVIPNLRIKIEKVMSNSTSPSLLKTGIFTYVPAPSFNFIRILYIENAISYHLEG